MLCVCYSISSTPFSTEAMKRWIVSTLSSSFRRTVALLTLPQLSQITLGGYLVKDKLTTEFIPAVAAAHSKQADSGNTRGIVAISLTDPVFLALPAILAA